MHNGPNVIAYDGSPAADRAIRESAPLLANRPALVVVVWEAGQAYGGLLNADVDFEPAALEYRRGIELDLAMYDEACRLAQQGAEIARKLGVAAEAIAVADEVTVAETLVRLAEEKDAVSLVMGTPRKHLLTDLRLGSTTRHVVRHAQCPVVVVSEPSEG